MSENSSPQIPESVREFVARRALQLALPEAGVQAAVDLMVAGFDSQALRVLAGADDASPIDLDDMIATVFDELSLHLDPPAAEHWLVSKTCRDFMEGRITHWEAQRRLGPFYVRPSYGELMYLEYSTHSDVFGPPDGAPEEAFAESFRVAAASYLAGDPAGPWRIDGDERVSAEDPESIPNPEAVGRPRPIPPSWHGPLRALGQVILVLAVLFGLFLLVILVPWNGRRSMWRTVADTSAGSVCSDRMKTLWSLHRRHVQQHGLPTEGGGSEYVMQLVAGAVAPGRARWEVWCPCDPDRPRPVAALDPTLPAAGQVSYVARDFGRYPLDPDARDPEPLMANRPADWQDVRILFTDGSARRIARADLGYDYGEPLVFGPESRSELLRVLCVEPADE